MAREDEIKGIPLQTAAKFLNSKPHGGNALYKSILANFLHDDKGVSAEGIEKNADLSTNPVAKTGGEKSTSFVRHSITQGWNDVNSLEMAGNVDENGEPMVSSLAQNFSQEELKKSAGNLPRSAAKRSSATADLSAISIAELADKYNPLFARVDENGEPYDDHALYYDHDLTSVEEIKKASVLSQILIYKQAVTEEHLLLKII